MRRLLALHRCGTAGPEGMHLAERVLESARQLAGWAGHERMVALGRKRLGLPCLRATVQHSRLALLLILPIECVLGDCVCCWAALLLPAAASVSPRRAPARQGRSPWQIVGCPAPAHSPPASRYNNTASQSNDGVGAGPRSRSPRAAAAPAGGWLGLVAANIDRGATV